MTENTPKGSLEELGIQVETHLPQGVMSPADSKAVRFTVSRPGYHFREVEAYKQAVDGTLDNYAEILHSRDMDIYNLGTELDRARVDILNLRHQIEVYEYKGGVAEADATDEEVETLLNNNAALQTRIQELEAANTEMSEWASQAEAYVASLEARIAELEGGENTSVAPVAVSVEEETVTDVPPVIEEVVEEIPVPIVEEEVEISAPPVPQTFPGITEDDLR